MIDHLESILSVVVTSDNKYIICGTTFSSIKIFDLQTKQQVHHFENAHKGMEIEIHYKLFFLVCITSVTVTPDDNYLISTSMDKSIKIFDLQTKQLVHHFDNVGKGMEIYVDFQFILIYQRI